MYIDKTIIGFVLGIAVTITVLILICVISTKKKK